MGICNTTTSAAVLCALTGADPVKRWSGAGITDEQLEQCSVVRTALEISRPDPTTRWKCSLQWAGLISPR